MNQEEFDLLEKYFLNELSERERQDVELRLQSDKDFRATAEEVEVLIAGVQRFEEQDLRLKMKEWDYTSIETGSSVKIPKIWPKWSMLAAAISILIATVFILQNQHSDTDDLFQQYYKLPQPPVVSARGEDELLHLKKKSFEAFRQQEYPQALISINNYLELENDREIRFYYALSLFELGEKSNAIQEMESLDSEFSNPTYQWYLALFYLDNNEKNKAIELLKNLREYPEFSEDATNILKEMP